MKIICKNGHIFEEKDINCKLITNGLIRYWCEYCPICGSDELYDGDVLSDETIKKLKAMEKRVIKEITEPERKLE